MKIYIVFKRAGEEGVIRRIFSNKKKTESYIELMNKISDFEWWFEEWKVEQ